MMTRTCVSALVLLLTACGGGTPAASEVARSGEALAPEQLHRCALSGEQNGVADELQVFGFGATEVEAREQAHLFLNHTAELLSHTSLWTGLLASLSEDPMPAVPWLRDVFSSSDVSVDAPMGWILTEGDCSELDVPSQRARFSVAWAAGTPVHAEADSLAIGITESRRRSCQLQWGAAFIEVFGALGVMDPAERPAMLASAGTTLRRRLLECAAADAYQVSEGRHPRVSSRPEAVFCQTTFPAERNRFFVGQASGASRERALEHAALVAVQNGLARGDEAVASAMVNGNPAERSAQVARGVADALVAATHEASVGYSHSRCALLAGAAPTVQWNDTSDVCGRQHLRSSAPDQDICAEFGATGIGSMREALASVSEDMRPRVTLAGWGEVQGCTARCRAEYSIDGLGAFVDTHSAHCGTEEHARATMARGARRHNFREFFHCASPALAGALLRPAAEDEERFWQMVEQADFAANLVPVSADGAVRLTIPEPSSSDVRQDLQAP